MILVLVGDCSANGVGDGFKETCGVVGEGEAATKTVIYGVNFSSGAVKGDVYGIAVPVFEPNETTFRIIAVLVLVLGSEGIGIVRKF